VDSTGAPLIGRVRGRVWCLRPDRTSTSTAGMTPLKRQQRRLLPHSTDVRFGSKADIGLPPVDVRFTPKSGHWNSIDPLI
jgi:hypothetical protein